MSDVTISFGAEDRISPVLRQQTREASKLSRTLKEAGQAASKAGGPLGGLAARVLGGAGGPFAAVAVSAAAASLAIQAMNAASERAVNLAKDTVTWQQRVAKTIDDATKARAGVAAGGLSQAQDTRLLLSRGGSIDQARANVDQGIELSDSLKGEAAIALQSEDRQESIRKMAKTLARTGETSFTDAVKRFATRPSLNAIDMRRELLDIRGQLPTEQNLDGAWSTLAQQRGFFDADGKISNVNKAITAGQQVGLAQSSDLTSGRTASVIQKQARDTLDPVAKAFDDLRAEVDNATEVLQAAADAQKVMSRSLAEAGRRIGMSNGSEEQALSAYKKSHQVIAP